MDRLDTRPKFPPLAAFAQFTILSTLPPAELTAVLERLFREDPFLGNALSCSRFGADNASLGCRKVVREDVFTAALESGERTLMLSIVPRTQDVNYRPDYEYFRKLKEEIARMLASHFGESNVVVK